MNRTELAELAQALDLSEADIEDGAKRIACEVKKRAELWQSTGANDDAIARNLRRIVRRHHVDLPAKDSLAQRLNRMLDASWWRRALRKRFRVVEQHEIACGAVHRQASPYVSPKALRRHERNVRRLIELLKTFDAINLDTGEAIPLAELIAKSQANPVMRRMAMMARTKGIEAHYTALGHEALFVTITAPSRMHARHQSGQANARFDGTTPRQAQTYLHDVWRRAMRSAARQGLTACGLRTVEPHHDGCPHWHVLVFTPSGHAQALRNTLQRHALADSPNEPGAAAHRFTVERIDPAKGSATSYIAKYVSKSIDGHGIDDDTESDGDGPTTARRVVAWARLHGIRQFQFFGLPAITPTRELYRHDGHGLGSNALIEAHQACKAKNYAGYLATLAAHGIAFDVRYEERPSSRYAGEIAHAIRGLMAGADDLAEPVSLTTRTATWIIQPRPAQHEDAAHCAPWTRTRFNNCAPPVESTGYAHSTRAASAPIRSEAREGRRRRPQATERPPSVPA